MNMNVRWNMESETVCKEREETKGIKFKEFCPQMWAVQVVKVLSLASFRDRLKTVTNIPM